MSACSVNMPCRLFTCLFFCSHSSLSQIWRPSVWYFSSIYWAQTRFIELEKKQTKKKKNVSLLAWKFGPLSGWLNLNWKLELVLFLSTRCHLNTHTLDLQIQYQDRVFTISDRSNAEQEGKAFLGGHFWHIWLHNVLFEIHRAALLLSSFRQLHQYVKVSLPNLDS